MKRLLVGLVLFAMIVTPILARAQDLGDDEYDIEGPPPYNDVEDGQLLKLASYVLMPIGYALEHGVTRPLHDLATNSAAAPVLSGDTEIKYFGEASNANLLPADTFRPFQMPANPTQMDTGSGPMVMTRMNAEGPILPPVTPQTVTTTTTTITTTTKTAPSSSIGQSAIH